MKQRAIGPIHIEQVRRRDQVFRINLLLWYIIQYLGQGLSRCTAPHHQGQQNEQRREKASNRPQRTVAFQTNSFVLNGI